MTGLHFDQETRTLTLDESADVGVLIAELRTRFGFADGDRLRKFKQVRTVARHLTAILERFGWTCTFAARAKSHSQVKRPPTESGELGARVAADTFNYSSDYLDKPLRGLQTVRENGIDDGVFHLLDACFETSGAQVRAARARANSPAYAYSRPKLNSDFERRVRNAKGIRMSDQVLNPFILLQLAVVFVGLKELTAYVFHVGHLYWDWPFMAECANRAPILAANTLVLWAMGVMTAVDAACLGHFTATYRTYKLVQTLCPAPEISAAIKAMLRLPAAPDPRLDALWSCMCDLVNSMTECNMLSAPRGDHALAQVLATVRCFG